MVKVLPEPVTPSSTWSRSWARTPFTISSIACGWSPCGSNSDTTRKRRPPSDLSGRGGRCGSHGGRLRMFGSPSSKSALSESAVTAAPVRPRGWLSGAGRLEPGLRGFAEPLRLGHNQSGIEQLGEMLAERMDLRPRGLGLRSGRRIFGERALGVIWGDSRAGERASAEALPSRLDRGWSSPVVVNRLRYVVREAAARRTFNLSGDSRIKELAGDAKGHPSRTASPPPPIRKE